MKYLIRYKNGNGYHCNCCRSEWTYTETMEFESEQKLKEYVSDYNKLYYDNRWDNDSRIVEAYPLAESDPIQF
jgi:hypothetical protein